MCLCVGCGVSECVCVGVGCVCGLLMTGVLMDYHNQPHDPVTSLPLFVCLFGCVCVLCLCMCSVWGGEGVCVSF